MVPVVLRVRDYLAVLRDLSLLWIPLNHAHQLIPPPHSFPGIPLHLPDQADRLVRAAH